MVVTNRDDLAEKIRILRSHGMTSLTWDRHQGHAYSYDVVELGYNYRIDEIRSALGRVQLDKLLENNERRKTITQTYWNALEGKGYTLPFKDSPGEPAYHIFPILLPDRMDRKDFIDYLRAEGIQTSIHYPPIHRFQYHRSRFGEVVLPVTEYVADREVTLPLYPTMDPGKVECVISAALQAAQGQRPQPVE
jgi:dTDP-4-amino-4,6-dideoxygalactose transaminase